MDELAQKFGEMAVFDVKSILFKLFEDEKFKDWILDMIREEQLYKDGVRGDGYFLGEYSPITKQFKIDPNIDHITLKETGDFYRSFQVTFGGNTIIIDADGQKDDRNLFEIYDNNNGDLLGLTEKNFEILSEALTIKIIEDIYGDR